MAAYQAAAYIRLSYTDDHAVESDSVGNQRRLIDDFVSRHPDIRLVAEKVDDGYSGTIFNRPAFMEMVQAITAGEINCVIVKDLSRLGREYIETGRYLRRVFPSYGVRFIAITDGIDTAHEGQGDDLTVSVKNIMNESYARDISVKTRAALQVKRRNGDFVGFFPVYGYLRSEDNRNQLVPDPYAADVVRDIFRMRLEGASANRIAYNLNTMGILSPLAYKKSHGLPCAKRGFTDKPDCQWSATTIIRILQDETYVGTLVQGKQGTPNFKIRVSEKRPTSDWIRVPNVHEALITRHDFDLVQRLKGLDTRTAPGQTGVYLFSGLLICGSCGSCMVRRTVRVKDKTYHYYHCTTGRKHGCDHPVEMTETALIQCVTELVKGHIRNLISLEAVLAGMDRQQAAQALVREYTAHIEENECALSSVMSYNSKLYESLVSGMITRAEYASFKEQYARKAEVINESIRTLKEKLTEVLENHDGRSRWIANFTQFSDLAAIDRKALVHMVKSIRIVSKHELDVTFTYQDEYQEALRLVKEAANVPASENSSTPSSPAGDRRVG